MNVIISNKYQALLANLDIDVIKSINGEFTVDDVAKKLGYSKQTLQRKLSSENTTFQKQLNSTREVLALNYLQNTDMTTSDIAYLLGYQGFNSFLRAFSIWKGMSISEYREKMNK